MSAPDERTTGYLIELRRGAERTVLAVGVPPLAPIAAELAAQGAVGELVVVRRGTGELVIRWPLGPAWDARKS